MDLCLFNYKERAVALHIVQSLHVVFRVLAVVVNEARYSIYYAGLNLANEFRRDVYLRIF